MKQNYQTQADAAIAALGGARKKLLLQCCCGPCSSYVLEYLTKHFNLTVLYYNPNIQPQEEYDKRLFWLREVLSRYDGAVAYMPCAYDGAAYDAAVQGLENEPEGGARCTKCFELRLRETAKRAKEGKFDFFCTTLTVSPHKDEQRLNAIGLALEEEFGVTWLPSDFKKRAGYARSNALAREYGLYRQNYCGCLYSRPKNQNAEEDACDRRSAEQVRGRNSEGRKI